MIITTFNIRGLGGAIKRNKVKELVKHNKVEFMEIVEVFYRFGVNQIVCLISLFWVKVMLVCVWIRGC